MSSPTNSRTLAANNARRMQGSLNRTRKTISSNEKSMLLVETAIRKVKYEKRLDSIRNQLTPEILQALEGDPDVLKAIKELYPDLA